MIAGRIVGRVFWTLALIAAGAEIVRSLEAGAWTPLALGEAGDSDLVCVTGSLFVVAGAIEQAVLLSLAV